RSPAALLDHGERQVDTQGHRSLRTTLGLGDLEVIGREAQSAVAVRSGARRTYRRVVERSHRVDRTLVAERPRERRAGTLIRRTRQRIVVLTDSHCLLAAEDPA